MTKIIKICLIFLLMTGWIFSGWPQIWKNPAFPPEIQEVQAAVPTFQAAGGVTSGTKTITPAMPGAGLVVTDDIILLSCETANEAVTVSGGTETWTEIPDSPQGTGTAGGTGATRLTIFWARASQNDPTAPTTNDPGNHIICRVTTYRGIITSGDPFDVTAGGVEATADTSVAIPGDTTTVNDTLIVAVVAADLNDQNNTAQYSSWTNADLTSVTEQTDNAKNSGNGGSLGIATGELASFGTYGNTTATHVSSVVKGMISIALEPAPTAVTSIVDASTNNSTVTIAPGGAATDAGRFSISDDIGGGSILSSVTVTFLADVVAGIALVQVWNAAETTGYLSETSPIGDTFVLTTGTAIPSSTTPTEFHILITPKSHVSMPGPNGALYAATAYITACTSSAGDGCGTTDSADNTVTIDNLSPGGTTGANAEVGDTQVTVSWTNPGDGDFQKVIIYCKTASISETPTEGSDPSVDEAACDGTARVKYSGTASPQTIINLTNSTLYYFRIFARDTNGNFTDIVSTEEVSATPTGAAVPTLIFSISGDLAIGFSVLDVNNERWATDNENGSGSEVSAHTLAASTNATNGYTITVNGTTLTSGGDTINAIGDTAVDVTGGNGTEQFGIRLTASGTGTSTAPYNGASNNYALDTSAFPDEVASGAGDGTTTTFSVFYAANIATTTEAHTDYTSVLFYIATGNF